MSDPDPDPVVPRLDTSGTRTPRQAEQPRTLGGTAVTVGLLLGGLLVASASPMLLGGLLLGLAVGAVAGVVLARRHASSPVEFCVPRAGLCLRI